MNHTVDDVRAAMRQARSDLGDYERAIASVLIAEKLLELRPVIRAKSIAVYMPFRGEVDCRPFAESAKLRKKRIFVPVLRKSGLAFLPFESEESMRPNRFGILEPVYDRSAVIRPTQLDVVVAPLVAFDSDCNRIGMGGGFYDRCFAFRKRRKKWRRPFLIGVGYDFQQVMQISPASWDVPLDAVVTEETCFGEC